MEDQHVPAGLVVLVAYLTPQSRLAGRSQSTSEMSSASDVEEVVGLWTFHVAIFNGCHDVMECANDNLRGNVYYSQRNKT